MKQALLILLLFFGLSASAQLRRTTRPHLKVKNEVKAPVVQYDTLELDSTSTHLRISGYEKPLRSTHETMLVANRHQERRLMGLELQILYYDMRGLMLHSRREIVPCDILAGESQMVKMKSWDVHRVFYYHINRPRRISGQGTAYRVAITPLRAIYAKL